MPDVDVVIIGGGYAGISVAYQLAVQGISNLESLARPGMPSPSSGNMMKTTFIIWLAAMAREWQLLQKERNCW